MELSNAEYLFLIADDVTFEFPVLIPVCCNTARGHWCYWVLQLRWGNLKVSKHSWQISIIKMHTSFCNQSVRATYDPEKWFGEVFVISFISQRMKRSKHGLFGCFPLCQSFRKFRSKSKWNGSAKVEILRSKRSTSRGGLLWPFGRVRQIFRNFHLQTARSSSSLHPVVKMADDSDVSVY